MAGYRWDRPAADDRINRASQRNELPVRRTVKRRYVIGDRGIRQPPNSKIVHSERPHSAQHKADELHQLG